MANRVLYIATNASAGMRHFVVSILNVMFENPAMECYAIVQSEPDNDYEQDIPEKYKERVVFMNAPLGKKEKICTLLNPTKLREEIEKVCDRHKIETIHFLTEDPCASRLLRLLKRRYKLYYTVHDLEVHEMQYRSALHKVWYYWSHRRRVMKLINGIDNLVTCSRFQYEQLMAHYPQKKVYYHVFPSLVTDNVKKGNLEVAELRHVSNYYLFFGRIEKYKGIELLYQAFENSPRLQNERLVIAGKGNVYFEKRELPNVIWINRFIRDEEIKDLFQKAKCVVLPYISATQSGIFSFCFYFGKSVVASDIPFFKEFEASAADVRLFEAGSLPDLVEKLQEADNESGMPTNAYEQLYGEKSLEQSLLKLYEA